MNDEQNEQNERFAPRSNYYKNRHNSIFVIFFGHTPLTTLTLHR